MSRHAIGLFVAGWILLFLTSGGTATGSQQVELPPDVEFRGLDGELAALGEEVPGFGGYYYDESGRLIVVLRELSALPALERRLGAVTPVMGKYAFGQLDAWRRTLRPVVLGLPGVVTLDVDEATNRVTVGVESTEAVTTRRAVRAAVRSADVPLEAVRIEEREPILFLATLRDEVRPAIGGLQIRWDNFLCTLGFNASRRGVAGFVTNSHCTLAQGGVKRRNATEYYQPLAQIPEQLIGIERVDPKYFRSKGRSTECPRGYQCRYSDSAWAEYVDPALSGGNFIARTEYSQFDQEGSIVLDSSVPDFEITDVRLGNTLVGSLVFSMGRSSGWGEGIVLESCVDVAVSGTSFALLCQDVGVGIVLPGDSGSPMFEWDFLGNATDATLIGLRWGGDATGTVFVYSPYGAVAAELGLDAIP